MRLLGKLLQGTFRDCRINVALNLKRCKVSFPVISDSTSQQKYVTSSLLIFSRYAVGRNGTSQLFSTFRTTPFATPKSVQKFHAKDGIPPKSFTMIYKTNYQNYLLSAQIVVFLSIGAVITLLVGAFLQRQLTEEERKKIILEKQSLLITTQRDNKAGVKKMFGQEVDENPESRENIPGLADIVSDDLEQPLFLLGTLIILAACIFKLMRMLPVRIYVGKKNHCVGVYYGSILPGKLTRHEFIAGTVKRQKSRYGKADISFKDGSGRPMVLLEHFFRKPADFDYLLGVTKSFEYADEDPGNMRHLKQIGAFGTEEEERRAKD